MTKRDRPRAIVIGAGVVGSCCALRLQREGYAVTLLDPAGFGHGCAEGTAGIFATGHIFPAASENAVCQFIAAALRDDLEQPVVDKACLPSLLPWFAAFVTAAAPSRAQAVGAALRQVLPLAIPQIRALLGEAASGALLHRRGWLHVYETELDFERAAGERAARRDAGIAVEELGPADLHSLEPALPRRFQRGAYLPDIVQVPDIDRLLKTIGETALAEGAVLRSVAADAVIPGESGSFAVMAGGERLDADLVVIAAGPHSPRFGAQAGFAVPHAPERGYSVTLPNAGVTLTRPVTFARQKLVAAPMAAGLRLTSTAEFTHLDRPPDQRHVERQLAFAEEMLAAHTGGAMRWHADRSATPDGLPVIGSMPGRDGLILAYGHGHLGLTLAGVTATLVAALATGKPVPVDMHPFRPDRFAITPAL